MAVNKKIRISSRRWSRRGSGSEPLPPTLFGGFLRLSGSDRNAWGGRSRFRPHQFRHAHQVVGSRRVSEHPFHQLPASVPNLAHQPEGLHPTEDFFHPLPFPLAHRVTGVSRGSPVQGTGTVGVVLSDVRSHPLLTQLLHQILRVVV